MTLVESLLMAQEHGCADSRESGPKGTILEQIETNERALSLARVSTSVGAFNSGVG